MRITAPVLAGTDIVKIRDAFARIQARKADAASPVKPARPRPAAPSAKPDPRRRPSAKPPAALNPVAAAIIRARTAAGLTQQQLAARLKTNQANIARLENNRSEATMTTLKRIAAATGHRLVIDLALDKVKR